MEAAILHPFAASVALDCTLLRTAILAGESVDQNEILSLASAAQAIFVSATLESRSLDDVRKCFELWREVCALFSELCSSWTDIESDQPAIAWLRGRLEHFRSLSEDRVQLYNVSTSERIAYCQRKRDEGWSPGIAFGQRGGLTSPSTSTRLSSADLAPF